MTTGLRVIAAVCSIVGGVAELFLQKAEIDEAVQKALKEAMKEAKK